MSSGEVEKMARHPEDAGQINSLIPALARAHRNLAGSLLHGIGLSAGQELLLMMLWRDEPRAQSEITRELAVEPPTVAKMLARLERAGIIERRRSDADRRVVLVQLTDAGRALERPVSEAWAALEEATTADLDDEERAELARLLRRVIDRLTAERQAAN